MNESHEASLIRRSQQRDKEAFCTLMERYRNMLFGTAYLMMRDRGQAEDIVQETLIQTWKHLPSFRLQSNIKTWLIRIVLNEVKQQFRKKAVQTVVLEQSAEIANDFGKPETDMILDENRLRLKRTVEMLSQEHREVVVLRYFSELTVPEIAAAIGQREGTVKSRLNRALNHLNEIIRTDKTWEGWR